MPNLQPPPRTGLHTAPTLSIRPRARILWNPSRVDGVLSLPRLSQVLIDRTRSITNTVIHRVAVQGSPAVPGPSTRSLDMLPSGIVSRPARSVMTLAHAANRPVAWTPDSTGSGSPLAQTRIPRPTMSPVSGSPQAVAGNVAGRRSFTRPVIELVRPDRRPTFDTPGLASSRPVLTVAGGERPRADRRWQPGSESHRSTENRLATGRHIEQPDAQPNPDARVPIAGSAPAPVVDLEELTAKVITAIDRRLIAHRERMGGR